MSNGISLASALHPVVWLPAGTLALLASCSSLAGDQSGGRYTAPEGLFSLPVPELSLGAKVEDQSGTNPETKLPMGLVSFRDDFGRIRTIQYEQLTPDIGQEFSDPARATGALRGYTHDMTLAGIQEFSPRACIVREEPVTLLDGATAWLAVLQIPEGSPMVETSAEHPEGRRLDSTRGFLVLCRAGLFLTLSAADDLGQVLAPAGTQPAAQGAVDPAAMDALKNTLTKLYSSMSFK